uniref:Uncharacterized protein n=1 Tax=Cucumis melo TaxID=3656 RepID=A0A9I9EBS2_CUCME
MVGSTRLRCLGDMEEWVMMVEEEGGREAILARWMLEDFLNVEGGGNLGVARSVITSTLGFFMGCFKVDVAFLFNGANEEFLNDLRVEVDPFSINYDQELSLMVIHIMKLVDHIHLNLCCPSKKLPQPNALIDAKRKSESGPKKGKRSFSILTSFSMKFSWDLRFLPSSFNTFQFLRKLMVEMRDLVSQTLIFESSRLSFVVILQKAFLFPQFPFFFSLHPPSFSFLFLLVLSSSFPLILSFPSSPLGKRQESPYLLHQLLSITNLWALEPPTPCPPTLSLCHALGACSLGWID